MYTYTPERKSKIEKVIKAFEPYILQVTFSIFFGQTSLDIF